MLARRAAFGQNQPFTLLSFGIALNQISLSCSFAGSTRQWIEKSEAQRARGTDVGYQSASSSQELHPFSVSPRWFLPQSIGSKVAGASRLITRFGWPKIAGLVSWHLLLVLLSD